MYRIPCDRSGFGLHQRNCRRRKSATSFSLPGLASSGTYSANFVILLSCWIRPADLDLCDSRDSGVGDAEP